eukprot:307417_1
MSLLSLFTPLIIRTFFVDASEIIDGGNEFGYDLSNQLSTDVSTNLWISPFCITSCFALAYPGSSGETQTQIANVMGYPTDSVNASDITQQFFALQSSIENTFDGTSTENTFNKTYSSVDPPPSPVPKASVIVIANKIYSSDVLTLKQPFIDALHYGTQPFIEYNFDFTADNAHTIINSWVKDNTNGLIHKIIDEHQDISNWGLVAMSAIYLKGSFRSQFKTELTSAHSFYSNSLRTTQVGGCHLMHQISTFPYYSDGNYQFLKLAFVDDLFVLFALPINHKLYDNKNGLITDSFLIQTAMQKFEFKRVALALPKISVEAMYVLNDPLKDLGMQHAFDSELANFSGISDKALKIDVVIHKTMVEMDEKGLVAAAVTLIGMDESAAVKSPTPKLFKADHPFQMFIIDGSHDDNILFMGQVNDPGIPDGSSTPVYDESTNSIWSNFKLYNRSSAVLDMNCNFSVICIGILLAFVTLS